MSDITEKSSSKKAGLSELNAENIAIFLAANMDFFDQHPGLLRNMRIPHETGKSISLIERQVAALRKENNEVKAKLQTLMVNARDNDKLFDKVQTLITELLEQDTVEEVCRMLEQSIQADFGACYCKLWLIAEMPNLERQQLGATQVKDLIRIIYDDKPYFGELKEEEYRLIFRNCPQQMNSVAVISLTEKGNKIKGVLAIGNSNENYYQDDVSTSLLEFIGKVVARIIGKIHRQNRRNRMSHTP